MCHTGPTFGRHTLYSPPRHPTPWLPSLYLLDPLPHACWTGTQTPTKIFEISVKARKERDESYMVNESLLVESDEPERSKEILR